MKGKQLFTLMFCMWLFACNEEEPAVVNHHYGNDSLAIVAVQEHSKEPPAHWPQGFEIGRQATRADIKKWDIDVSPDGSGLPRGEGDASRGKSIYELKCLACHGREGIGGTQSRLVAVMGDTARVKAIGNYWPYASTLFDYIRRTMPYNAPGSLSDDEVYSLSAYLLSLNKVIDPKTVLNQRTLPKVKMPAQDLFINDDRRGGPEVR